MSLTCHAAHVCHAQGCTVVVAPKLLMCPRHWRMVPAALKGTLWSHYRPGQEVGKNPTPQYLTAAQQAIDAVAAKEDKAVPHQEEAQPQFTVRQWVCDNCKVIVNLDHPDSGVGLMAPFTVVDAACFDCPSCGSDGGSLVTTEILLSMPTAEPGYRAQLWPEEHGGEG